MLTLSNQLEKNDFLLGQDITVFDFSIASMLASILFHIPKTWLTDLAEDYPIFPAYLRRVSDRIGGYPFMQNDPANPGPCWSHSRDYGVLASNPFPKQPSERREPYVTTRIRKGEPLRMAYTIIIHESDDQKFDQRRILEDFLR